jgi:hypothetical protein
MKQVLLCSIIVDLQFGLFACHVCELFFVKVYLNHENVDLLKKCVQNKMWTRKM